MKYTDFNNQRMSINDKPRTKKWFKSAVLIALLAITIYGVKLLVQPIGSVLGSFLSNSTSIISYMISNKKIAQTDGVTNALLVGIDRRGSVPYTFIGEGGKISHNGFLADTIIVASFNHQTQEITLLSLPRDLWVKVEPFGRVGAQYTKINAAHALGDEFNYDGGGMALLKKVVEDILGIPIHYWARIDFEGFEKAVDAIGGVDIFVENSFDDYMYPREGYEDAPWQERFEHVHFDAGLQHMDGKTALEYARSRKALGSEGTDFARARRQQNLVIAAKNKILSSETLFNLTKVKNLYLALSENVATNVEIDEAPLFFNLVQKYQNSEIKAYVLNGDDEEEQLLYSPQNLEDFGGAWVLLPKGGNWSKIQEFVHQIFYEFPTSD